MAQTGQLSAGTIEMYSHLASYTSPCVDVFYLLTVVLFLKRQWLFTIC